MGLLFKHKWIIVTAVLLKSLRRELHLLETSDLGASGRGALWSCRGAQQNDKCHSMILRFGASVPTDGANACVGRRENGSGGSSAGLRGTLLQAS